MSVMHCLLLCGSINNPVLSVSQFSALNSSQITCFKNNNSYNKCINNHIIHQLFRRSDAISEEKNVITEIDWQRCKSSPFKKIDFKAAAGCSRLCLIVFRSMPLVICCFLKCYLQDNLSPRSSLSKLKPRLLQTLGAGRKQRSHSRLSFLSGSVCTIPLWLGFERSSPRF